MPEEIYIGLDVGSCAVRVAVGKLVPSADGKEQIHIVGAVEVPSSGIHKGTVTNLEDAVSSVSRALEQAERITCLLYTSPSPRDGLLSRMPSSA